MGGPNERRPLDFSLSPHTYQRLDIHDWAYCPLISSRGSSNRRVGWNSRHIVSGLVYAQSNVAKEFVAWFNSGAWTTIPFELPAVHVVSDSLCGDAIGLFQDNVVIALFDRLLPQYRCPDGLRHLCIRCICILIKSDAAHTQQLASLLQKKTQPAVDRFVLESVCIASRLQSFSPLTDLVTQLSVDCSGVCRILWP
ncbi:hypothetical protein EDD22DRAFT_340695 [Suillus occidentalis]|nr:hypothetical protein EDD22DRAFT_340695 [Suillus occidentalis]